MYGRNGIFITTSDFTKDALDYVSRIDSKIILIDGATLSKLMIDFGVGVTTVATYNVKKLDSETNVPLHLIPLKINRLHIPISHT